MKRNIVFLHLMLLMAKASAQIEGNVVDTSGNIFPGAVIIATDSSGNRSDTVTSDKTGYFEFKKLKRGNYRIVTIVTGFQTTVLEKIQVNKEASDNNPGGDDVSNAVWLEIVMRRNKPPK